MCRLQTARQAGSARTRRAGRANARRIAALALVAAATFLARAQTAPPAPTWAVAVLPSGAEFSLEVAADAESRERGYMFRDRIGEREGMIFLFPTDARHPFWMKNCRVRLDILWLDASFRVVDVAHDRAPCVEGAECPSVQPVAPARYVVELAGGTARREGTKRGDAIVVLFDRSGR